MSIRNESNPKREIFLNKYSNFVDSFNRLRISSPTIIFDTQLEYGKVLANWFEAKSTSATITHLSSEASVLLRVTGDIMSATRQSRRYFRYQPGRCVGGDELITLPSGERIKAAELVDREFSLYTIVDREFVAVKATAAFNEIEPVYELIAESGRKLIRNADHPLYSTAKYYKTKDEKYKKGKPPFLYDPEWNKVSDLEVGDLICAVEESPYIGEGSGYSIEQLKLFGYLLGDGSFVSSAISFTRNRSEVSDEFVSIVDALGCIAVQRKARLPGHFGIKSKKSRRKGCNPITNLIKEVGLLDKRAEKKFVPPNIFNGTKQEISIFLSRLFATDGWAYASKSNGKFEIGYSSVSERLARDVQTLLYKLGIRTTLAVKKLRKEKWNDLWSVLIYKSDSALKFCRTIGIFSKESQVSRVENLALKRIENGKPQDRYMKEKLPHKSMIWERIVSIEELSEQQTIAISVPGPETFVTDFYEHNSQFILLTFGDGESATAVQKFVGYGDASNGIFFKSDEFGYYFVKRTNTSGVVVDTAVEQIAWNMDKMNGNGPSRTNLDFTKVQILAVDLEWLGVGRVRCGFVVDGVIVYAHEFTQANIGTEVYMKTANLPIRYHIVASTNATGNNDLKQICASVMSEGGESQPTGMVHGADTGSALITLTSEQEVISIRPKTTFKGFPSRINIVPSSVEVFSEDATIHYHLIWGGETNSSAAGWTAVSTAHSGVEYSTDGTDITGGMEIHGGFVPAAASQGAFTGSPGVVEKAFRRSTPLTLDIAGTHPTIANSLLSDQLGVVIAPTGDTDIGVTIQWVEEH